MSIKIEVGKSSPESATHAERLGIMRHNVGMMTTMQASTQTGGNHAEMVAKKALVLRTERVLGKLSKAENLS